MQDPSPTLATVAKLANVSVASASRVINGIKTNPETMQRVREAAEAVGYVPNAAARSLRSRRTGQIAFAMPDVSNPVYISMVSSIAQVARAKGSRLILHSTDGDLADELGFLEDLKQRYVDGLILVSLEFTPRHAEAVENAAVPVVVIGTPGKGVKVDTVRPNSRRGAADAVRHLYGLGRRRIALVNGPEQTAPGSARKLGYLDGLRACGLERDAALMQPAGDFTIGEGTIAVAQLMSRAKPDAIFCANDLLALGALSALRTAGKAVPDDVALVGMDNTNLSEVTSPPLTSVDIGSGERARLAAELLLARIEHPNRRQRVLTVDPTLVVRESCGAAA